MRTEKKLIKRRKKAPPPVTKTKKVKRKKREEAPSCTCGVCGEPSVLALAEADENWELPGHPDHLDRDIGRCCVGWLTGRWVLITRVVDEVVFRLRRKNRKATKTPNPEVSRMITEKADKLRRLLSPPGVLVNPGEVEDQELTKWASKLDIEAAWLEEHAC